MKHSTARNLPAPRRGMSLIEVIAVIIVLLFLLSIFMPAMQGPRVASRRLECQNNLRCLALAATNYATTHNGKILLLTESAPGLASGGKIIWTIHLLPHMDNAGAFDYIIEQKTQKAADEALHVVLSATYKALTCPQDASHFKHAGGLNYVPNIGYGAWRGSPQGVTTAYDFAASDHSAAAIDWNGNGKLDVTDKEVARATGVFWTADGDEFRMSLDDIVEGDGSGSTILFSESLDLPPMHLAGPGKNGINPSALEIGIGLGCEALRLGKNKQPSLLLVLGSKSTPEFSQYFAPNSKRSTSVANTPAARSMHKGCVNVVFADGHLHSMSNEIDWSVWASLHTPNGQRHGEAQLAESDY